MDLNEAENFFPAMFFVSSGSAAKESISGGKSVK
jgi:hypothetical protein